MTPETPPTPETHPLGVLAPGEVPTPHEFALVTRERCRLKTGAAHAKALASAVFAAFGAASRPVLASRGLIVGADGTVSSEAEGVVDRQWAEIVGLMHGVHGDGLRLPCDTHVDPATGRVVVEEGPV